MKHYRLGLVFLAVALVLLPSPTQPTPMPAPDGRSLHFALVWRNAMVGTTTRVSVSSDGTEGNGWSYSPSISADGRYVAFSSWASNLVPGDTNSVEDVFLHDRQTGQTTRVSVSSDGAQANNHSLYPAISGDGRYVAFESWASNLVAGDTNDLGDVFVHDRQTGQTTRVSVSSESAQGNGPSSWASISTEGRYVAFWSGASNLVPGDTNSATDVFVHDRQTAQTTRVSVSSTGTQGYFFSYWPSISGDGRYVAFWSYSSNLVEDHTAGGDNVFVHDRQTGQTTRVSVSSDGTGGNGGSYSPHISGDGRYVGFYSGASNLVAGDNNGDHDVFVHDRQAGQTTRVSVSSEGAQGNGPSYRPSIAGDGRYLAFESYASNLVAGDTNGFPDVFLHDRQTGQTTMISLSCAAAQGNGGSYGPSISGDGRYVAFWSYASNLVAGDTNGVGDIFVHQRW